MKINYWYVPGIKRMEREVFPWEVIKAVAEFHNVVPEEVRVPKDGRWRYRRMRMVAMYVWEKYGRVSQKSIGEYFGGIKQASVSYSINKVGEQMDWCGDTRDCVEWVEYRLFGRVDAK